MGFHWNKVYIYWVVKKTDVYNRGGQAMVLPNVLFVNGSFGAALLSVCLLVS